MSSSRRAASKRLRQVDIFAPESGPIDGFAEVAKYVKSILPKVKVELRPRALNAVKKDLDLVAGKLASARVKDPSKDKQSFEPMFGEVDYELRTIKGSVKPTGVVYDGRKLQELFLCLLGKDELLCSASVVLTDRLISTFSRDDLRHHLRTVVCGFPSIVSVPGIVEAPAKPREYYLMRQRLEMSGAGEFQMEQLKHAFRGRFLDYGDPETVDVLKGLVSQAIVYHLTLEPFCNKNDCRLFNAHWQEELIKAQVKSGRFCKSHAMLLKSLGENPVLRW